MKLFALISCVFAYSRVNINTLESQQKRVLETRAPHPYEICRRLVQYEALGYQLPKEVNVFLNKCARKYGLERDEMAIRVSQYLSQRPHDEYY
ncbi:Oidioi.mRNA.OKI2018_I69.chr2.g5103.t1.cds [Oikopleura dioica]|uniref:Oidioi.mRNA.OKI2018_I69.chr2.g5103.t1.cds n=1 Tax=Oikopleura dioica TaxID=34765 RepID=A0ABN7T351_OIKDI|nr:Oidioi.mRNA.OKI2018_I69.chr2.g5103.t1.cds [Oikopleura dioica]